MIISFEGIDGSGKSTQAKRLLDRLGASSLDVLYVREPGGTAVSERIRTLLLDPSLVMDPFAEMLLFSAARAQLVREKIRPFHEAGGIVICDRFFDSTVAYQGGGRQVADPDWLGDFQRVVTDGGSARPDVPNSIRRRYCFAASYRAFRTWRSCGPS